MGRRVIGRPRGERRGRPRVRGRARARRPRSAARAFGERRARRRKRRREKNDGRSGVSRAFVFARARVPRAVRVDVPRRPDGPRAHRRASQAPGNSWQAVARAAPGRRLARGAPRRLRRAPRRRLPILLRRLPRTRRALLRAGRGIPRVRRETRDRKHRRIRGDNGGEFREVPGGAGGGARPARVRGRRPAGARVPSRGLHRAPQARRRGWRRARAWRRVRARHPARGVGAGGLRGGVQGRGGLPGAGRARQTPGALSRAPGAPKFRKADGTRRARGGAGGDGEGRRRRARAGVFVD